MTLLSSQRSMFLIILTGIGIYFTGCSGDGDKGGGGGEQQPSSVGGNSASAIVETGVPAWTTDANLITKNDNDGAEACAPSSTTISPAELAERTYNRQNSTVVQKVHCKSDIEVQLTPAQKQELETALGGLKIVSIKGSDSSTCSRTSGFLNSWTISSTSAGVQTYFTNPTSNCGDIKILRGTESVNALLDKYLRASGKL